MIVVAPQGRTRYAGDIRVRTREGYRLRIECRTPVRVRLFMMLRKTARNPLLALIYRLKRWKVIDAPSCLPGYCVVTDDAGWTGRLICDADAMRSTASLLADAPASAVAASMYFAPDRQSGRLCFGSGVLPPEALTAVRVWWVVEQLGIVARAAERTRASATGP
ncbi:MAG: hypothetical protein AB7P21_19565 [Lautropia sp.]